MREFLFKCWDLTNPGYNETETCTRVILQEQHILQVSKTAIGILLHILLTLAVWDSFFNMISTWFYPSLILLMALPKCTISVDLKIKGDHLNESYIWQTLNLILRAWQQASTAHTIFRRASSAIWDMGKPLPTVYQSLCAYTILWSVLEQKTIQAQPRNGVCLILYHSTSCTSMFLTASFHIKKRRDPLWLIHVRV